MSKEQQIVSYVEEKSGLSFNEDWFEKDNLLQMGILDSLSLMKMLMFIEDVLDTQLDDEQISYEHLTSLEKIKSWYLK